MRPRRLALRRETLTMLTNDSLAAVQGASVPPVRIERITTGCITLVDYSECLAPTPTPPWTQFCE